jgi:hypothetical protein
MTLVWLAVAVIGIYIARWVRQPQLDLRKRLRLPRDLPSKTRPVWDMFIGILIMYSNSSDNTSDLNYVSILPYWGIRAGRKGGNFPQKYQAETLAALRLTSDLVRHNRAKCVIKVGVNTARCAPAGQVLVQNAKSRFLSGSSRCSYRAICCGVRVLPTEASGRTTVRF